MPWICCANKCDQNLASARGSLTAVPHPTSFLPTGELEVTVRHTEREYLNGLSAQIKKIFEGAALCTGTTVDVEFYGNPYDDMNQNHRGTHLIEEVMADMGLDFEPGPADIGGSSDIGNVSYQCAAFHPKLRLAGPDKVCHAKEFADAMLEPTIEQTIVDGANIIGAYIVAISRKSNMS